jgi:hypothetical protein
MAEEMLPVGEATYVANSAGYIDPPPSATPLGVLIAPCIGHFCCLRCFKASAPHLSCPLTSHPIKTQVRLRSAR